jgi:hypothetical protein
LGGKTGHAKGTLTRDCRFQAGRISLHTGARLREVVFISRYRGDVSGIP